MIFMIHKTSNYDGRKAPHSKAFRHPYLRKEQTYNPPDTWYELGENHTTLNGLHTRDIVVNGWVIECETIGEILDLVDEVGEVIIKPLKEDTSLYCLEIYDDYRE